MRSIILTVIVLGVLVGAFALFMLTQSNPPTPASGARGVGEAATRPASSYQTSVTAPPATQSASGSGLGQGEDVWIQQYDKQTGDLLSEFRADRYDPPVDGVVHVIRPESRFYISNGQVLTISARDGQVIMPEQTRKSDRMDQIQSQPPSRGTLNEVTLGLLEDADAVTPVLTCALPIVSFDNDALRLNTVQSELDGRIVPADRVPITVRGRDYDFDGEGLTIRWNQRDQRLEHLEVARGKRLAVKNIEAFGPLPMPVAKKASVSKPLTLDGVTPIQLASTETVDITKMSAEEKERRRQKRLAAARRAKAQAATQKSPREPVAYRALFADNVTIFEGDSQIGAAERMQATFSFDDTEEDAERDSSVPATQPLAPATQPATRPVRKQQAKPQPQSPQPQQPIEIRWTGKLTVTPVKYADSGLRSIDDRVMQFDGAPARLWREGSLIEAAGISAASAGNRFSARGNDKTGPVKLNDPSGMKLIAPGVDVVGDLATVTGASSAELMVDDEKGVSQKLSVSWKDKGTLHLTDSADGKQRSIDSARFEGDVDVKHPQLHLKSDALALAFEPARPGEKPAIKTVDASGKVDATIVNESSNQTVQAGALILAATRQADGKSAFSSFKASGGVAMQDAKQKLSARQVEAVFAPVKADAPGKSSIDIEKLTAEGNVAFEDENGSNASAEVLSIEAADAGVQRITLQGNPARVADKESKLSGKIVRLASNGSSMSVVGAGSLSGLAKTNAARDAQPLELTWSDAFDYESAKNLATVSGNVVIRSRGQDGAIDQAAGKRMLITLTDSTDNAGGPTQAIGKKTVQSIELHDEVEISSVLTAPGDPNHLLRRVHLFAPGVTVWMGKDGELGPVSIPTPGRMLYEDHRADSGAEPQADAVRGAVAIEWAKSMTYEPAKQQVVLEGDVVAVHQQPGEGALRMVSQKVVADLQNGADQKQQLKQVRAEGGASFASKQIRFDAADATYDPAENRVIARGTERQPVEVFDETGLSSGSFQELWWNLKENRPERLKNVTGAVRR